MLKSMYSGVSGIRGFQTKLDNIGNNIANVNTVGFKKSRTVFQDLMNQTISGATAPVAGQRGGVNAKQIGLGAAVSAVDVLHTPGSPMMTGVPTDMAINGDGFFVVTPNGDPTNVLYSRAGNMYIDAERQLVTSQGHQVLGQVPEVDATGTIVGTRLETIKLPTNIISFDIGQNGDIIGIDENGQAVGIVYDQATKSMVTTNDPSNTVSVAIGQIDNPAGLRKVGGSMYEMTANANPNATHNIGTIDTLGNKSSISVGVLEMSNVDLTEEMTEMIVAQRGLQANSRIITTSDEVLQEIINLKR